MKNSQNIIYLLFFILGVFVAYMMLKDKYRINERVVVYNTDTLVVTKYDTVYIEKPKYITKYVIDTLVIEKEGTTLSLPVIQKHYSQNGIYDAWVSGVSAELDSIRTYNKTEYKTITETKVVQQNANKVGFYPYVGLFSNNGHIGERIGMAITTKKRLMFSGEVGLMNGKVYYGANVGYKIN